jgi:hypothetical protein
MAYQWTAFKSAGLIIGILLFITVVTIALLFYRHRTRKAAPKPDPETAATSPEPEAEPEPTYSLPGSIHDPGTIRRTTGEPQTFYDWVQSSNVQAGNERLPSLENGPGPGEASSMYSRPTVSRANTLVRPGTRDSIGASSFRKAVLEAGNAGGVKSMQVEKKEHVPNRDVIETKEEEKKPTTTGMKREYSGAWP